VRAVRGQAGPLVSSARLQERLSDVRHMATTRLSSCRKIISAPAALRPRARLPFDGLIFFLVGAAFRHAGAPGYLPRYWLFTWLCRLATCSVFYAAPWPLLPASFDIPPVSASAHPANGRRRGKGEVEGRQVVPAYPPNNPPAAALLPPSMFWDDAAAKSSFLAAALVLRSSAL